jgi:phosphoenolpyruvate phosphomutase
MRRLVSKLEQRGIAGVCIEDKLFPKTNSLIRGACQPLASIEEFTGKIKAGKDTQNDEEHCIVARVEALIAGWGLEEALRRAEAYHGAGADAVLIHSKNSQPREILEFMKEWGGRCPVVIVPTKYYKTPTEVFENAGVSVIIWANHLLRSAIKAMKQAAAQIYDDKTLLNVEEKIATLAEVFSLQSSEELVEAEKRYLPVTGGAAKALILAASRGDALGALTLERPKALINIKGKPLLNRMVALFNDVGIKDITVVRGFKKEMIAIPNLNYVDNDDYETTQEVFSLHKGLKDLSGTVIVSYGDILFKKYIPMTLLESEKDFTIVIDADWEDSRNKNRYADFVSCDQGYRREEFDQKVVLLSMGDGLSDEEIDGEWAGMFKLSENGLKIVQGLLDELSSRDGFGQMRMSELFNELTERGHSVHVSYIRGHWIDIDDLKDFSDVGVF